MNAKMMETELPDHGEIIPAVAVTAETDFEPVAGKIGDEDAEQVEQTSDQPVEKETESTALVAAPVAAEPAKEISEERFWKEIDLLGQLAEAERDCQKLEGQYSVCKNEMKDLKEELKVAEMRVRKVSCEILDLLDGRELPSKPEPADATQAIGLDVEDTGWREISTTELLSGIKGIGAKKLDALVSLAPTVGHLIDLQIEASKEHRQFKELLPKGFGDTAVDAIEEKIIDAVKNWGATQVKVEPRVESVDLEWIEKMRAQLAEEAKETLEFGANRDTFAPNDDDDQAFIDGYDAFRNKRPITEAPSEEADPIGEWIRGWIYAEIHENWKDAPADSVDDL